jgi:hypothetical protein
MKRWRIIFSATGARWGDTSPSAGMKRGSAVWREIPKTDRTLCDEIARFDHLPYMQDERVTQHHVLRAHDSALRNRWRSTLRCIFERSDSNLPVFARKTMQTQVDQSMFTERLIAVLSAFFGMLAAIGLYGVRAYSVARRTPEIGIRMGAGRGSHQGDLARDARGRPHGGDRHRHRPAVCSAARMGGFAQG